jgi:hypothetical protein
MQKNKTIAVYKEKDRSLAQLKTDERVKIILEQINSGTPNPEIVKYCAELWHIKPQSVYSYINLAVAEMAEYTNKNKAAIKDEFISRYTNLYRIALQKNQLKTAKSILDSLVKILGLQAPTQIEVDANQRIINISILPPNPNDN